MKNILDLTFKELKTEFVNNGIPASRTYSIVKWIYQKSVFDFNHMTDMSKAMRADFAEKYKILTLREKERQSDKNEETIKFLFETEDGHFIESVLILAGDEEERRTVCVSSQIGCALGCAFCATGKLGFTRNLKASEIISQVLWIDRFAKERLGLSKNERAITNIVYMGMGEPMENYEEVKKSIHILNFSSGFNLGKRHFTISTAGIVPEIKAMSEDMNQVRLAVSLNSTMQDKRYMLMPITGKYSVKDLIQSVRDYQAKTNRRVTFEYILIPGINDDENDVINMKRALYKIKYNLNLIPFNPNDEIPFDKPSAKQLASFRALLKKHGIPFVERYSKGQEIAAACGQLGVKHAHKQ